MNDLFLITGGGTGAKVAESLLHLCAAGLGPKRIHVLLIDSDTANGNLSRTTRTLRAYQKMQQWPWSVQANVRYGLFRGSETVWLELFGTQISFYEITQQIRTVLNGGLETVAKTPEMHQVLDLLYDPAEQEATCDDGFRARPNLGCLLMADHLSQMLEAKAKGFLDAMQAAVRQGGGAAKIPVVVSASVFGGTGASLIPIIRRVVERILQAQADPAILGRFEWAAVKLLPHYMPAEKKESVDPDRFLLDAASALQFYSTVYDTADEQGRYDAMYVIGSDKPGRNRVRTVLGHSSQANPAYFEEVLAGLAVLHFCETVGRERLPMRIYSPERLSWEALPYLEWQKLRLNLAYLLHLAALYLRRGNPDPKLQKTQGIGNMLKNLDHHDLMKYPWYDEILDDWAEFHAIYKAADRARRVSVLQKSADMGAHALDVMLKPAADYFGRLLLWVETALKGEHLPFLDYSNSNYAGLYSIMAEVKAKEIDVQKGETNDTVQTIEPEQDNALIRVLRTTTAAMVRIHKHATKGNPLGNVPDLIDPEDRIRLHTSLQQTVDTLREFGMGSLVEEYTRTHL